MVSIARWSTAAFLCAALTLIVALQLGGGSPQPAPAGIPDPGALTGWGLPVAKLAGDLTSFGTLGFLLAAVFLLPSTGPTVQGLASQAVRLAHRCALGWTASSIVLFFFTVSDVFAVPLSGSFSWRLDTALVRDSSLGQGIIGQIVFALLIAALTRWTISIKALAIVLGLTALGLAPIALTGHAAGSGSHDLATVSLLLHLVGVSLWVGGLAALGWVAWRGSKRLPPAINRFSVLASWCFVLVAVSGAVNAAVRLGAVGELLGSRYGLLVIGKIVALGALGVFGFLQRRRIAAKGQGFLRLCATELLIMAATVGLAVALSRTPTPVPENLLTSPVEELLGGPLPQAPTLSRLLWGWSASGVGLALVGLLGALYICGLVVLRRRGVSWPISRTLSWTVGLLIVSWATFGGLGEYSHVLFSAHMGSHMMLSMVAPIFLILAAPMTLALRALPGPRQRGELAPRQMLVAFLNSPFSRFITHPIVGPVLFVGSLYGLYFTELFPLLMRSHIGHSLMIIHFLAVGTLYYYVLIGVDPSPRKLPPLVRFGVLLVTVPFHAFFAISVMSSRRIFAYDYWQWIDRPYLTDLLRDQYVGGSITWAMGEVPLILVMGALFVQWFTSDRRESRRFDRAADHDGDHELEAYNAYLAGLQAHGQRREP